MFAFWRKKLELLSKLKELKFLTKKILQFKPCTCKIIIKIYKEGGIVLTDYSGQKYIVGRPRRDNPITLKLLKKNLNWKLILNLIKFFRIVHNGDIEIENGSLLDFLNLTFKNLGNNEITKTSYYIKNYNF